MTPMSKTIAPDPAAQQAIEWMVHQQSGEMTDAQRAAFERWRAEDIRHDLACRRIEQALGSMPQIAAEPSLRNTLNKNGSRRQFLQNTLAIAAVASTSGWLYDRQTPLSGWFADLHTGTSERRTTRLADSSIITLNARSSIDVNVNVTQRHIQLIKGQIYIDAPSAQMPLRITTRDGQVNLNSGIFTVSVRSEGTRITALSQPAQINAHRSTGKLLQRGQGALINDEQIAIHPIVINAESAWLDGLIEVNDQPLEQLVEALRDYRTGIIRLSPDAAKLKVSGIFPLDNTDYALDALMQTLPVVVSRTTGYWISISKA